MASYQVGSQKSTANYDYQEVESPPPPTTLPPRALQWTDMELQKRMRKRKTNAIILFVAVTILMVYLILLSVGMGGVWYSPTYSKCEGNYGSSFQAYIAIDMYIFSGLRFAEAKTIDVVVDLLIGQGGRAALAYMAYIIFGDSFTRMLESSPVTYELYVATKFNPTSMSAIVSFAKGLLSVTKPRSRFLVGWFIFASLWVLAFPTMFSAATGYFSPSKQVYRMPGGLTYFDSDYFGDYYDLIPEVKPCLQVENGHLIDLADDSVLVQGKNDHLSWVWWYNEWEAPYAFVTSAVPHDLALWQNLSNYFYAHRVYTTYSQVNLSDFSYDSVFWINNTNLGPVPNKLTIYYQQCWNDTPIDTDASDYVACVQQDGYVYGFSMYLAWIFVGFQMVWTAGMFGIWWDAQRFSNMIANGWSQNGVLKNAYELGEVLKEDLGANGCSYSEKEMLAAVRGRKIKYVMDKASRDGTKHVRLSSGQGEKVRLDQACLYG